MLIYLKHKGWYLGFMEGTAHLHFAPHVFPAPFAYERGIQVRKQMAAQLGLRPTDIEVEVAWA